MSLLDRIFEGTTVDLTPIQAQLDDVEAINSSQQAQLDAVAAELAGFGDAQEAIDTLQDAAIAATEAVNTAQAAALAAQQAAQDAAAAIDTAHSADITALQATTGTHTADIATLQTLTDTHDTAITAVQASVSLLAAQALLLERMSSVDLRRFVPNGILTDANIDDAIDAAIAYAQANTGIGLIGPGCIIRCPAGIWTLSRPHHFPAFPTYRIPIGFWGAGQNESVFLVTSDVAASAVFTFGTESFADPLALGMQLYLFVGGFSIIPVVENDCLRTAIRIYGSVNPYVRNIRTRQLNAPGATDAQCRGIEILPATVAGTELNSQFVDVRDCDIYGCLTGVFVRAAYPVTFDNVQSRGCAFENAILQNTKMVWNNSDFQGGGPIDAAYDRWYGNRDMPGIVSGYDSTTGLQSGSGATCAAASGRLCLVTLPGATLDAREDKARWIRLIPTGAPSANKTKVAGVYKVERILSATTMLVRKGSNHAEETALDWQICQAAGEVTFQTDNVYNESGPALRATFGAWRDSAGGSEWTIQNSECQGGQFTIEANRVRSVTVERMRETNSSTKIARLEYVERSTIDQNIARIEYDDFSYFGLDCFDNRAFPSGSNTRGTRRSANGGSQVRTRAVLREFGAAEIWDARVASSLSLTGADVNNIAGILRGNLLIPHAGGVKSTYTALDPELDTAAIVGVTGIAAARCFMHGTIPAAHLPDHPYTTTLVLVGRTPDTTIVTTRRVQAVTTKVGGEYTQHIIGLHDSVYLPTGAYQYYASYNDYPTQQGQVSFSLTPDTDPHVFISSAVHSVGFGGQARSWDREIYASGGAVSSQPSHCVGSDMIVSLGGHLGATESGSLVWTIFSVIPHSLSHAEQQKLVDCTRNEFPLEA